MSRRTWVVSTLLLLSTGCSSPMVYKGVVIDAGTKQPLARATVSGSYYELGAFGWSHEGLRDRVPKAVHTVTDSQGRFEVELRGKDRSLSVIHTAAIDPPTGKRVSYKIYDLKLEGVRTKELVIELERE